MTTVALSVVLILVTFYCVSSTALFTLVAVTRKVVVNNNYKYVNVTSTANEIGPITNHSLDIGIQFLKEIRDVKGTVQYHLVLNKSVVPQAFVTRTVDVCHFLKRPTSDRLLNLVYVQYKKSGKLPERCPIPPEYYYIRNFRPSAIAVPGFLPENDFLLKEIFQTGINNKPLFTYQFYGSFVRKPIERNSVH
ncbi:uncharacterized protein LOC126579084 [Anopheles aquasalis]|uniref:uncharacterized protein LOC126579084 n=1 Tax=Anopheles aquasalis TaxID=42839 RepID=UPI00215A1ED0|nr:uncharacterized protein LOC126579084 [Anopheles aquasalis]